MQADLMAVAVGGATLGAALMAGWAGSHTRRLARQIRGLAQRAERAEAEREAARAVVAHLSRSITEAHHSLADSREASQ